MKRKVFITLISLVVVAVLAFVVYSIATLKSPSQKIIDDLKNIKMGVDEEAYKEINDALQKFKDSTTP